MTGLGWKVGDIEVNQLVEVEAGSLIQSIIKNATPDAIRGIDWLRPHFADDFGKLKAVVQAFLVRSGGHKILVDACNGNGKARSDIPEWNRLNTTFLDHLGDLGLVPGDVDSVVCTHLHCDHVGWNTVADGTKWRPTFPKAVYHFVEEEYKYWATKPEKEIADDKSAFEDSVRPIMNSGLCRLVQSTYSIAPGVRLTATPGHTPGHCSVLLESRNQRGLISGDFLHHPCQIAHPEWRMDGDTDPDRAVRTRTSVVSDLANAQTRLFGSHFANPVVGRVSKVAAGFRFSTD